MNHWGNEMRSAADLRELDARTTGGVDVQLLWDPDTGDTAIRIEDSKLGARPITFSITPAKALDAFHHPYAYVPARVLG